MPGGRRRRGAVGAPGEERHAAPARPRRRVGCPPRGICDRSAPAGRGAGQVPAGPSAWRRRAERRPESADRPPAAARRAGRRAPSRLPSVRLRRPVGRRRPGAPFVACGRVPPGTPAVVARGAPWGRPARRAGCRRPGPVRRPSARRPCRGRPSTVPGRRGPRRCRRPSSAPGAASGRPGAPPGSGRPVGVGAPGRQWAAVDLPAPVRHRGPRRPHRRARRRSRCPGRGRRAGAVAGCPRRRRWRHLAAPPAVGPASPWGAVAAPGRRWRARRRRPRSRPGCCPAGTAAGPCSSAAPAVADARPRCRSGGLPAPPPAGRRRPLRGRGPVGGCGPVVAPSPPPRCPGRVDVAEARRPIAGGPAGRARRRARRTGRGPARPRGARRPGAAVRVLRRRRPAHRRRSPATPPRTTPGAQPAEPRR